MKKIILLIAFTTILSCKTEVEKKIDYAVISGKIENTDSKKAAIYNQYTMKKIADLTIAEDGTFSDTLKTATDFYALRQDKNLTDLYIPKGSILKIEYDATKKDSTVQFSGSNSAINKYLSDKVFVTKTTTGDQKEMFLKDEADFKAHLLKIKTAEEDLLMKTKAISENFKNNELKNIKYTYLSTLNKYELYHGYYSKDRSFKASENFLDELKNIDLENENDFIFSKGYRSVVENAIGTDATALAKKDSIADDIAYLKLTAKIKNDKIKNKLLYDAAKYGVTYTENLEEFYTLFTNNSTDEENNKEITTAYNKLKALATGSPSPKFVDYENYAGGTTSLDDLKGKYLYLDIWATWCGPCIAEIPSLKKLEKEYHNKNIEFISISIDKMKDHEKWKEMIVDKDLKGLQLFADNNWESKFIEDYQIKGIPRFILIDPKGNIVNANAPRPSDKKLVETLQSLEL
ncbi:TlpA family protein disulfide reductase [Polaribacter atrinae]|uniref:TlpA family protein disulfide reductase n=1 Tax=Polaribacter atrinae TaxID=1333662 RepID=UPI0024918C9A|nr:TlpA disulfide reductase family protein [Polaribacter atrinae]